jgi:hypothetical protein
MDRAIALCTACGGEADPSATERTVVLVIEVPWPYVGSEAFSSGAISERTMRRLHGPV